jgi:methionyl-tRNA formyltransferase
MKIGFLVSGSLGDVVVQYFEQSLDISFVMTDKSSTSIINFCNQKAIPLFVGNPRNERANKFIKDKECNIIASVNYLFLINKNIIDLAKDLCFNIHGSLLPKYRGRTPHVWAIINNEKRTGITAHVINEGCDTGDIIEQIEIPIEEKDTGATILEKYKKLYIPLIKKVLQSYESNKMNFIKQDETKATYFGKRTPEDGQIDWNWQAERIVNWVRAQAYPYPGAFTFYKDKKITIDKVSICDYGFHYKQENGIILSISPLIIKASNSAVKIESIRQEEIVFEENKKFN